MISSNPLSDLESDLVSSTRMSRIPQPQFRILPSSSNTNTNLLNIRPLNTNLLNTDSLSTSTLDVLSELEARQDMFPNVQIISEMTQNLAEGSEWAFPPIFRQLKVTSINAPIKYTVWQIMFNPRTQELYSKSGNVDGAKIEHNHPIVPKAGRSVQQQALLEARRRHLEKRDEGFREVNESAPTITLPMLANKYEPNRISQWPVSVETKLDGERIRAYIDLNARGGVSLMSRTNKPKPWLDNIRAEVKKMLRYLPEGTWLDGEIYSPELTFEEQRSAISTKNTKNPNNDRLQYFIFDVVTGNPLVVEERNNLLAMSYAQYLNEYTESGIENPRYLLIVPMLMAFNDNEIQHFHDIFVNLGYEGIIIRRFAGTCTDTPWNIEVIDPVSGTSITSRWCTLGNRTSSSIEQSLYRERRSNNLLKYKYFKDEEGVVVDLKQGTGVEEGTVLYVVQDPRGNIFSVRPRGSHESRREIYTNFLNERIQVSIRENIYPHTSEFTYTKADGRIIQIISSNPLDKRNEFSQIGSRYLGKMYTYRYQETTSDGVPRFPVGISFRTDI